MPISRAIIEGALKALRKPAIPELAERALMHPAPPELAARGVKEVPEVLSKALEGPSRVAERAAETPFAGPTELRSRVRATRDATPTPGDRVQDAKEVVESFFASEPNIADDLQEKFYEGRWRRGAAADRASIVLRKGVLEHLTQNPAEQATLLSDLITTMDTVAQGTRHKWTEAEGVPMAKWQETLDQLSEQVRRDPEIMKAHEGYVTLVRSVFDDMVSRGYISPDRRLEDYTPRQMLVAVAEGLAHSKGEPITSEILSSMRSRTRMSPKQRRETNLVTVMTKYLTDYYEKVATDDFFQKLVDDPTINFTDKFQIGDEIPKDLAIWRPGPGMPGYKPKLVADEALDTVAGAIMPEGKGVYTGGYVLPKRIVEKLADFQPERLDRIDRAHRSWGGRMARFLTVYFPGNTQLNRFSDLPFALLNRDEKANPLMMLRFYPEGTRLGYATAYGNREATNVTVGEVTKNISDLVREEGVVQGTLVEDLTGKRFSEDLLTWIPEEDRAKLEGLGGAVKGLARLLEKDRLATELAPRIAAGLEAVERTGDWSQFGRVARDVTLRYGAGAPQLARKPLAKAIAPFIQFVGLASNQVHKRLVKGSGSRRAEMLAALIAVPTATMFWNAQNEEFEKVEDSLKPYERNQMHIIVPDVEHFNQTGELRPLKDWTGKPVVLRARIWVPEEVARTFGLGNLPSRLRRVAVGRDKVTDLPKDTAAGLAESVANMMTMPQLASDVLTGEAKGGRPIDMQERALRVMPGAKAITEAVEGYKNRGVGEAAKRAVEELAGIRFANVEMKGKTVLDADLMESRRNLIQLRARLRAALAKGNKADAEALRDKLKKAIEENKRLVDALRAQRESKGVSKE